MLSGLPVENRARRHAKVVRLPASGQAAAASMNLAEVPKWVIFGFGVMNSTRRLGGKGEAVVEQQRGAGSEDRDQ